MANEIIKALAKAHAEIKAPVKSRVGGFKNKYATLDDILDACRISLANNGLVISHTVNAVEGSSVLVTTLYHESGETLQNTIPLLIEGNGNQKFASALTYARRYAVSSLLSLPSDDDDDGQEAEKTGNKEENISMEQAAYLVNLAKNNPIAANNVLKIYKNFSNIPTKNFDLVTKQLTSMFSS